MRLSNLSEDTLSLDWDFNPDHLAPEPPLLTSMLLHRHGARLVFVPWVVKSLGGYSVTHVLTGNLYFTRNWVCESPCHLHESTPSPSRWTLLPSGYRDLELRGRELVVRAPPDLTITETLICLGALCFRNLESSAILCQKFLIPKRSFTHTTDFFLGFYLAYP